jgi:hypothetical protein
VRCWSVSLLVRLILCAGLTLWMAAACFAAGPTPQIAHGPTFPPDPWGGGNVAHGPTFPPDPWGGGNVAHGPTFPPDPWGGGRQS